MAHRAGPDPVIRSPSSSGLADVLDILLDKGLVIDAFVRVSLVGIELITIDARIVIASVDTYLRFAEAVDRLNLREQSDAMGIDDLMGGGSGGITGAVSSGLSGLGDALTGSDSEEEEEEEVEE